MTQWQPPFKATLNAKNKIKKKLQKKRREKRFQGVPATPDMVGLTPEWGTIARSPNEEGPAW